MILQPTKDDNGDAWNVDFTSFLNLKIEPILKKDDIVVLVRGTFARYEIILPQHATLQDLEYALKKQTGFKLKKCHFLTDKSKYIYPFSIAAHEGYDQSTTLKEAGIQNLSTISVIENVIIFQK